MSDSLNSLQNQNSEDSNMSPETVQILKDYQIWKKNSPYLYDTVGSYELEWPSLTVSWFPDKTMAEGKRFSVQRLLLGTHTSDGEPNSLIIAHIKFPLNLSISPPGDGPHSQPTLNSRDDNNLTFLEYSEENGEYGGFGQNGSVGRFEIFQRINHPGEVNRARYMPQNFDILATKPNSAEVLIFDRTRHPSEPPKDGQPRPELRLAGHTAEGYGLSWNPFREGDLLSASDDGTICRWNINDKNFVQNDKNDNCSDFYKSKKRSNNKTDNLDNNAPLKIAKISNLTNSSDNDKIALKNTKNNELLDKNGIKIVKQNSSENTDENSSLKNLQKTIKSPLNSSLNSALKTQQKSLSKIQLKSSQKSLPLQPLEIYKEHKSIVEDVAWHLKSADYFASASDDCTVRLWDARTAKSSAVVTGHRAEVNSVAFSPHNDFYFLSGSKDKTVGLWDMRNPSVRLHILEGHDGQIFRVDWSPFHESIVASCGADRRVLIWDLAQIGREQTPEDAQDGPPELFFSHGGHTDKVSDFGWNASDEWTLASVADDNVLQCWTVAEALYADDDEVSDVEVE